jgi:hypothetical protein
MRKFVFKMVIFVVLFSSIFISSEMFTSWYITLNADFKLKSNPHYIVLGHSHPECAFNDTIISNLVNLSESGESYYYTFQKTKKILEQNKSIKIVFIEFTNNQISEIMNDWIWGMDNISNKYSKLSPFINLEDKLLLLNNNPSNFVHGISLSLRYSLPRILKNNFDYTKSIGAYRYLIRDKTDSLIVNQNKKILKNKSYNKFSLKNIEYLDKIIKCCKKYSVKVYLIRSPLHQKYEGYNNEFQFEKLLSSKYSGIEFLDFSKFPLKNTEFGDLEHLNYRGSTKFSIWFNDLIKKGVLNQRNKQQFIDLEMYNN